MDSSIQLAHIFAAEGRSKAAELVDDAAKGPDIAIIAIFFIVPYFRTSVIRSSCLSLGQSFLQRPRNIQISYLQLLLRSKEEVCWFEVAMDYLQRVEVLQSSQDLAADLPDLILVKAISLLESLLDHGCEISPSCELHHDAKMTGGTIEEGLPILDYIGVLDRSQHSYLI